VKAFGWPGRGAASRATPRTPREAWDDATAQLIALRGEAHATGDAIAKRLAGALGAAQRVAALSPRPGYALIAGTHLVVAAATRSGQIPSESHVRSVGHAAAALKLAGRPAEQEATELERVVEERFTIARARIRGSIYVPRDVEYAFAGQIEGVRALATDSGRSAALERLVREGIPRDFTWSADDVAFLDALIAATSRTVVVGP
jgi:hypothetical protein